MEKKLILFDVCDTLYDSNTTFDYLRFVLRQKRRRLFVLKLLSSKNSPIYFGGAILGKLIGRDFIRSCSVRLLKGFSRQELERLSQLFFDDFLSYRKIDESFILMETYRSHGDIWLFSNSIDPVVSTIARKLGVGYECSRLKYNEEDVCTGEIEFDMTGRKKEVFIKRFGNEAAIYLMCSDNRSDFNILSISNIKVVIVSSELEKEYWRGIDPHFIERF